jgi:hypothetical protein
LVVYSDGERLLRRHTADAVCLVFVLCGMQGGTMSQWIYDRAPRNDELKDNDLTFVTILKETPMRKFKFVCRMSGSNIKAYFGQEWRYSKTILAWLPVPEPWDEDKEAEEAARLLVAMRSGDDAKLRECLGNE